MAEISAADVKTLREKTGVGMMECKKALSQAGGDMDAAIKILRETGAAKAEKRMGRATSEGLVHSYIHGGGKLGVLVEINCETDFVARTDHFQTLANDIAMQVAANPQTQCVTKVQVPEKLLAAEREILTKQSEGSGKPPEVIAKMVEGRLKKFYAEICLLDQPFVKDDKKTVDDIVKEAISQTGENISVRRFARFQLGEELPS